MSSRKINAYSFSSNEHWSQCLVIGFAAPDESGMALPPRLGTHARPVAGTAPSRRIATDRFGTPYWLGVTANGEAGIGWSDEFGALLGPFPIEDAVANSNRLQLDRHWLWAFAPDHIMRYDRAGLQRDVTIAVSAMTTADCAAILDIAVDGRDGLWVLLDEKGARRIVHLDCHGCANAAWVIACEVEDATQLAVVDGGKTVALLSLDDHRLSLVEAATGKVTRILWLGTLDPCFKPERIASNAADWLVLSGLREGRSGRVWSLFILDRFGELTRPALSRIFRAPEDRRAIHDVQVVDFAVARDRVWFATSDGLWVLDGGAAASGSAEAKAILLSPLLYAPPDSEAPGWLRAEIGIDLPEGAGITASFATTGDPRVADRVAMIAADDSQPRKTRHDNIWSLLDHGTGAERQFTVAGGAKFPGWLSIPLFGIDHRWLAVKLDIDVPPFVSAPRLKSLRVLYSEQSLMRNLPAIFSHPDNDPERVLRRLVGVMEATSQAIDEKIDSIGSHIDSAKAPREWLDYLGSWLDLPWHVALADVSKRALLRHAGYLLKWRGTRQGLIRLLECLAGDGAAVSVIDVAAERAPVRLGGKGLPGSAVRGLLAGRRRAAVTLGRKSILGRARLSCRGETEGPLDILVPLLLITIEGDATIRAVNAQYLDSVIAQYATAGTAYRLRWTPIGARSAEDADTLILDGRGPRKLGADSMLGLTTLGGRPRREIGPGFDMDFQIR